MKIINVNCFRWIDAYIKKCLVNSAMENCLFLNNSTAIKWPITKIYINQSTKIISFNGHIGLIPCVPRCSSLLPCPSSSSASVCFAVCLLSLAWALVLYARACSLIRPGHLQMTPAAILCRLVWRVGSFLRFIRASKIQPATG